MKSNFLIKAIAPPLIAAIIPAVLGYVQIQKEEARGWDRVEMMVQWAEEDKCDEAVK